MKFWTRTILAIAAFLVFSAVFYSNARTVGDLTIFPHEAAIDKIWLDARLRDVTSGAYVIAPGSTGSGEAPITLMDGDTTILRISAAIETPLPLWLSGNRDFRFEAGAESFAFRTGENGRGLLWRDDARGGLQWTSRNIAITRLHADTARIKHLFTNAPGVLTIMSSNAPGKSIQCMAGEDRACTVDLSVFDLPAEYLHPYGIAAALAIALFCFYFTEPRRIREIVIVLNQQRVTTILFLLWLLWLGWVFSPGMYQQDTIIHFANANGYSTWYSSLYMLYNYVLLAIGLDYVVLLHLPIFMVGVYNIMYLCREMRAPKWYGAAFVCAILLLPATVLILFGIQRYFTYGILLFTGLTFAFRYFLSGNGRQLGTALWAIFFLACAALMRSEWWLIFGICAGLLIFFSIRRKSRREFVAIAVGLALTPVLVYVVDYAIPTKYRVNVAQEKDNYRFLAVAALAYAYLPTKDSNPISRKLVEIGFTEKTSNFDGFMRQVLGVMLPRFADLPNRPAFLGDFTHLVKDQFLQDPKAVMALLAEKAPQALAVRGFSPRITGGSWEINDSDSIMSNAEFYLKTNGYVRVAMDYFRYPEKTSWKDAAYLATFDVYRTIDRLSLSIAAIAFGLMVLLAPIVRWAPCVGLVNLGIIGLVLVVTLVSPAASYGYYIFLPVWTVCAFLLARLEYLRRWDFGLMKDSASR